MTGWSARDGGARNASARATSRANASRIRPHATPSRGSRARDAERQAEKEPRRVLAVVEDALFDAHVAEDLDDVLEAIARLALAARRDERTLVVVPIAVVV